MLLELVGTAVETTLAAPMSDADMSFTLTSADGWPDGASGNPFPVTIGRGSGAEEKMLCSSRSGTTVTVSERGYDGTTAAAHAAGVEAIHSISAEMLAEVLAHANDDTNDVHTQYVLKSLFDANTILAATSDNTPAAVTMGASTFLARLAAGNIKAASVAEILTLLDVPTKSLWDANSVVIATSDNTPVALSMGASTILARLASGDIIAATPDQLTTLLALASTDISDFEAAVEALIPGGGGSAIVKVKAADESVTSSTTLQNDNELVAALEANTNYMFEVVIFWSQTSTSTQDIKVAFTVPASASLTWAWVQDSDGNAKTPATTASGTAVAQNTTDTDGMWIRISGSVRVGATAGNLTLQWAQNNSVGNATTVKAGSTLHVQAAT